MKLIKLKGFTLIELLISITIMFILLWLVYIPYSHYQNKLLLKQWVRELSQSVLEIKNLAINWVNSSSWNLSVWLYINTEDTNWEYIKYFSYPFSFTWSQIDKIETTDIKLIKTKTLPYGVKIEDINWEKEFLFFFTAISGEWKYIYWDNSWNKQSFTGSLININLSFKNSSSQSLQKSINYYTKSSIIDYN